MKNKSYNSSEAVRRKITTHAGGGYSHSRKPQIASYRSLFIIITFMFFCLGFMKIDVHAMNTDEIKTYTNQPTVTNVYRDYDIKNGKVITYINLENSEEIDSLLAPTWTYMNQRDMVWDIATKCSKTIDDITYNYKVTTSMYDHRNTYGRYFMDFYLRTNGITSYCPRTDGQGNMFYIENPNDRDNYLNDYIPHCLRKTTGEGKITYYLQVNVSDSNGTIAAPTWTKAESGSVGSQDDIVWYNMSACNETIGGITYNYKFNLDKQNHHNDYGPYYTDFYAWRNDGSAVCIGGAYYMLPTTSNGYHIEDHNDDCGYWVCDPGVSSVHVQSNPNNNYDCKSPITEWHYQDKCGACHRKYWLTFTGIEYYANTCIHYSSNRHMGFDLTSKCTGNGGAAPHIKEGPNSAAHILRLCTDHKLGNEYYVVYDGNGATSGEMSYTVCTYGTAQNLAKNAFKKEYTVTYDTNGGILNSESDIAKATLNYWDDEKNNTTHKDEESVSTLTTESTETVTLKANWKLGSVELPTPTKAGFVFDGWYDGKTKIEGTTYTPTQNTTLKAAWKPKTYTVSFDANGGTGTMRNQMIYYDSDTKLNANTFTRTGYEFDGWATSKDGGKVYEDKQTVRNLTSLTNATITLYAKWTPNKYTVTYNANGGTGSMSNQLFTYDVVKPLNNNGFSKIGYTFKG